MELTAARGTWLALFHGMKAASCFVLTWALAFSNSRGMAQGSGKVEQAEKSSSSFNNLPRRGVDVGLMAFGYGLFWTTRHIPQTENVIAAKKALADLNSQYNEIPPEVVEAQANLDSKLAKVTIEETLEQRRAIEMVLDSANRLAKTYDPHSGKELPFKPFKTETLDQWREAESKLQAELTEGSSTLISKQAKAREVREAQRLLNDAEKAHAAVKKRLEADIKVADFKVGVEEGAARRNWLPLPGARLTFGIIFFAVGAGDIWFAWRDNETTSHVATPHEMGELATYLVGDKQNGSHDYGLDKIP
jgi:hypothetical protein